MKNIKYKVVVILTFSLLFTALLVGAPNISAISDPENAPSDWAFEASSVELNDAIIARYPELDNGLGFVTKASAKSMTGELWIGGKNITGTMNGIENFTSISRLNLYKNKLTGEIPKDLGNLSNLTALQLSNNKLSGEIPSGLGNLSNLTFLELMGNELTGEIPSSLGNLKNLEHLSLQNNQLSGEIPSSLGDLNNLIEMYLARNQLSGEIPSSLGDLHNLIGLYLQMNQLRGEIPNSLHNLSNLSVSNFGNNQFTSISQSTYDFLASAGYYYVSNQTYIDTLTTMGATNRVYTFDSLPAYEQFPNYSITFEYSLTLPDGTISIINPTVSNGKVTIAGGDLLQVGNYILVAKGTSSNDYFSNIVYTTNFSIEEFVVVDEIIEYLGASANGKKDKETSTKINIDLSKTPDIGELTIEDILLTTNTKSLVAITKDSLTSLGNGVYELTIRGTWNEGTDINVVLEKDGVIFTPDTHSVTLHTRLSSIVGSDENNEINDVNDNNIPGKKDSRPKTGDTDFAVIAISIAGLLSSSGYLITRRKGPE